MHFNQDFCDHVEAAIEMRAEIYLMDDGCTQETANIVEDIVSTQSYIDPLEYSGEYQELVALTNARNEIKEGIFCMTSVVYDLLDLADYPELDYSINL